MTLRTLNTHICMAVLAACALLSINAITSAQEGAMPDNSDQTTVYRVDPKIPGVSPIAVDQLKRGSVYNYYSHTLNRRAWSFYLGDGQFWHAMGPNSVQPVDAFDFEMSRSDAMELLRQRDPELAKQVSITGENVFLMLGADDRWRLIPRTSVPRVFDAETGLEWEKQFGSYLHVIPRGSMLGIGLGCCGW